MENFVFCTMVCIGSHKCLFKIFFTNPVTLRVCYLQNVLAKWSPVTMAVANVTCLIFQNNLDMNLGFLAKISLKKKAIL